MTAILAADAKKLCARTAVPSHGESAIGVPRPNSNDPPAAREDKAQAQNQLADAGIPEAAGETMTLKKQAKVAS